MKAICVVMVLFYVVFIKLNCGEESSEDEEIDPECFDGAGNVCMFWVDQGHCESKTSFMERNCRLSCGKCTDCNDRASNCAKLKASGFCSQKGVAAYMNTNCRETCEICSPKADESTEENVDPQISV